jgi:hypothetical protein
MATTGNASSQLLPLPVCRQASALGQVELRAFWRPLGPRPTPGARRLFKQDRRKGFEAFLSRKVPEENAAEQKEEWLRPDALFGVTAVESESA